jgi:hypothetical protein
MRRHTLDNTAPAYEGSQGHSQNNEALGQRAVTPDDIRPISPLLRRTNSEDMRRDRTLYFHPQMPRSATRESLLTSAGESEEGGWATPRTGLSPSKSPFASRRTHSPVTFRSNAGRELYNIANGSNSHRNASSRSGSGSSGGTRAPPLRGLSPVLGKSNGLVSSISSAPAAFLNGDRGRYSGEDRAWFEDSPRRSVSARARPGIPQRFMNKRDWLEGGSRDAESVAGSAAGESSIDEIKNTTKIEVGPRDCDGLLLPR